MPARYVLTRIVASILLFTPAVAVGQSSSGSKTTPTTSTKPTTRPPVMQEERRLVFLTGHVKLDDGTEPSERVAIERVCNGRARREGYSDAHGAFGFQLGSQMQLMQDASVSGMDTMRGPGSFGTGSGGGSSTFAATTQSPGITQRELMGCELRATLAGYVSESIDLAGRQLFDSPDVGTLVLHRMGKVEGTKISVTTMQAPPEAKKAFEHARNALRKNHKEEAEREARKAIDAYPNFAEAMSLLGEIYSAQGRNDEAEKVLRAALDVDSKFVGPYFNLAMLASERHDWQRMAELTDKALVLDPYEYPALYMMNAAANYNLHNLGAAEKSARMCRRFDGQYRFPRTDFILANILMQRRDYAGAAEQLRAFLQHAPSDAEAEVARKMLAQTEERMAAAAK